MNRRSPSDPMPLDHLGLSGDGDDVDLVRDIEYATGLSFGSGPQRWTTIGDMEDAVFAEMPVGTRQGKCASMMAFHKLRSVLRQQPGLPHDITPDTRLRDLGVGRPREFLGSVRTQTGLHVHQLSPSPVGWTGHALLGAGILGPAIVGHPWLLLLIFPGLTMMALDPRSFGALTVGELAADAADRNLAHLARDGADIRQHTVRMVLRRLVARSAGVAPTRIDRSTRFFAS